MKRLIPAAVLLLLIIAVGFISSFTVLKTLENFTSEIDKCEHLYSIGETDGAAECAEKFKKEWLETAKRICAYTNHRPGDDISALVPVLPEAAKYKNGFQFVSLINHIRAELQIIRKEQSFNLENFY